MGDPRKIRTKFEGPRHPWQKERIEQEKIFIKDFGLKNKKEIWKINSRLKTFAAHAKRLVALTGEQAEKEKMQLLQRINRLGLLDKGAVLEDILGLATKDLLERRLQTIVCRKGFSKSMKQARQFIVHGHVLIHGKKVTAPAYLVPTDEEQTIEFLKTSALADPEHPERRIEKTKVAEAEQKPEKKPKKAAKKEEPKPKEKPKKE